MLQCSEGGGSSQNNLYKDRSANIQQLWDSLTFGQVYVARSLAIYYSLFVEISSVTMANSLFIMDWFSVMS